MLFFGLDDISKMVNQVQLPRVFLINFVFAGEFDAVLEQVEDLLFVEARMGIGLEGLVEGEALAAVGGGACVSCPGAFELVVVGAQDEGAGRRLDAESLLPTHRGIGA